MADSSLAIKNTTSALAANHFRPVSSSYTIILNRYLGQLLIQKAKQSLGKRSAHSETQKGLLYSAVPSANSTMDVVSLCSLTPLIDKITLLYGYKSFGLDVGQNAHPSDYGIFSYVMMNCSTVGAALQTAAEHKVTMNQNFITSFTKFGDTSTYKVGTPNPHEMLSMMVEMDFSTALQFGRLLVDEARRPQVKLQSVHFQHAPLGPVEHYQARFECPVYFEAESNFIMADQTLMSQPVFAANPKTHSVLSRKICRITQRYKQSSETLSQRVKRYLATFASRQLPSSECTAHTFNMSLSSFKKHLRDENTCYQDLCNALRFERCVKLMKNEEYAIKEISFELGFANTSAFNRAFKRWTGQSPAEYRKQFMVAANA